MSEFVVVDASLAIKWLIEEEDSPLAQSILRIWERQNLRIVAPFFMPFEVANVVYRHVMTGSLTLERAKFLITNLLVDRIELRHEWHLHSRAIELATQLNQGAAYDSHYLALAEQLDCELWTADAKFFRASNSVTQRVRLLSGAFAADD